MNARHRIMAAVILAVSSSATLARAQGSPASEFEGALEQEPRSASHDAQRPLELPRGAVRPAAAVSSPSSTASVSVKVTPPPRTK
jgi:hypothetical protein